MEWLANRCTSRASCKLALAETGQPSKLIHPNLPCLNADKGEREREGKEGGEREGGREGRGGGGEGEKGREGGIYGGSRGVLPFCRMGAK